MFNRTEQKTVNYCIAQAIEDVCSSLIESCMTPRGIAFMAVGCAALTGLCYLAVIKTAESSDEFEDPSPSSPSMM